MSLYDDNEEAVVTPPQPADVVEEKKPRQSKKKPTQQVEETSATEMDETEEKQAVSTMGIPEFEEVNTGYNIESREIPPFEYGYKTAMTKENFELDIKALFPARKLRRVDPTVTLPHGSDRPIRDSLYNHPNDILYGDRYPQTPEEENLWRSLDGPARCWWLL